MRAVVMKFGGSSVVDATAMRRVIRLVSAERERGTRADRRGVGSRRGHRPPPGAGRAGPQGRRRPPSRSGVAQLLQRHLGEAAAARGRPARSGPRLRRSRASSRTCAHSCRRSKTPARLSPRVLDAIAATGELLSSRIVAAAMAAAGLPAVWVDAREVVLTDDRHTTRGTADRRDRRRRAGQARAARRCRVDPRPRRFHRPRARTARRRRSAAAARTIRRRSSAPASAPPRSRSGPTSTAC